jgi:hypothetical protein
MHNSILKGGRKFTAWIDKHRCTGFILSNRNIGGYLSLLTPLLRDLCDLPLMIGMRSYMGRYVLCIHAQLKRDQNGVRGLSLLQHRSICTVGAFEHRGSVCCRDCFDS